ncbi:MAG: ThuA domain-containing protein [Oscillospiraceae bacterium]|nr:ThuA domain-containing protein [Oscillospiraceae bacterium]
MEKIKALIISGKLTIEHNYRATNERIRTLLESTGRFDVKVTENFRGATMETVRGCDLLIYDYDGKDMPTHPYERLDPGAEETMFRFIREGGGFMIHHSAVFLDEGMPEEYYKVWGYYCPFPGGRRVPKDDFSVQVLPGDPITDGLNGEIMCPGDDIFGNTSLCPGTEPKVLANVFDNVDFYKVSWWPPKHHPVEIPNGDLNQLPGVNTFIPVAWTNTYGKGRVFACSIGHEMDTFRRFDYVGLFVRGCEWAATGKVTMDKPDRSGDRRLIPWPYYTGEYA